MVSSKKKWTVMNPIRRRMKQRNPSSGQNGQLVHWWLLIHCTPQQLKTEALHDGQHTTQSAQLEGGHILVHNHEINLET
jgi:hypothetical protein